MPTYYHQRGLLLLTLFLSLVAFATAGSAFGLPAAPGRSGSLLRQPEPVKTWAVVAITLVVAAAAGTLLAGRWKGDLGLAAAAAGLAALSARGGPMHFVLLYADGPGIHLALIVETALLFALIGGLYYALASLGRLDPPVPPDRAADAPDVDPDEPTDQKLLATVTAAVTMAVLMMILCRTDDKAQCLASVFASAFLGALCAHQFVPARPSAWYWAAPAIVAAAGYGLAYFDPAGLAVGNAGGYLAPLARPLPLDYASAGVFGSALAYHLSRRIRRERAEQDEPAPASA